MLRVLTTPVTRRLTSRLVAGVLVLACVSCGPAVSEGSGRATPTATAAGVAPPPAQIPAATLQTGDGDPVQDGVRFAHTWIVGGRIQSVEPQPPLPWPPPIAHRSAEENRISIPGTPSPVWVEIRVYDKLDRTGAPTGTPLRTVTCDPGSGTPCEVVPLTVPGGGPRMITVNAAWPVSKALAREVDMPANMASVRVAWLFRLTA